MSFQIVLPEELDPSPIIRLANLADQNGIWATALFRLAQFMEGWKKALEDCDLTDLSETDVEQADRYIRRQDEALQDRLRKKYRHRTEKKLTMDYPSPGGVPENKRKKLWGYPPTAILRWMGNEGWKFREACRALLSLDIDVSPSTIRVQLNAGAKPGAKKIPELTEEQSDKLYDAEEAARDPNS